MVNCQRSQRRPGSPPGYHQCHYRHGSSRLCFCYCQFHRPSTRPRQHWMQFPSTNLLANILKMTSNSPTSSLSFKKLPSSFFRHLTQVLFLALAFISSSAQHAFAQINLEEALKDDSKRLGPKFMIDNIGTVIMSSMEVLLLITGL